MPFTIHTDPHDGPHVVSRDDDLAVDAILEADGHDLARLTAALAGFLDHHPGHVDGLAHLLLVAIETGDEDLARRHALEALVILRAGGADTCPSPLDRHDLYSRPVLRLANNAVLAAWSARDWELADLLCGLLGALDGSDRATAYRDGVAARADLWVLRRAEARSLR